MSELCRRRRRRRSVASVPTVCVDETRAESVGNGLFHGKQSSQFPEAEVRSPKVGLHTALREVESPARLHAKVGRLNRPKKRMCCSFRRLQHVEASCQLHIPRPAIWVRGAERAIKILDRSEGKERRSGRSVIHEATSSRRHSARPYGLLDSR